MNEVLVGEKLYSTSFDHEFFCNNTSLLFLCYLFWFEILIKLYHVYNGWCLDDKLLLKIWGDVGRDKANSHYISV